MTAPDLRSLAASLFKLSGSRCAGCEGSAVHLCTTCEERILQSFYVERDRALVCLDCGAISGMPREACPSCSSPALQRISKFLP